MEFEKDAIISVASIVFYTIMMLYPKALPHLLPLNGKKFTRGIFAIGLSIIIVYILILKVWIIKCEFLALITWLGILELIIAISFIGFHIYFDKNSPKRYVILAYSCMTWFVCCICAVLSLVFVYSFKNKLDNHILSWSVGPGSAKPILIAKPPEFIVLHGGKDVTFKAEADGCSSLKPETYLEPNDLKNQLQNGLFIAPDSIKKPRVIDVLGKAPCHASVHVATIRLEPDPKSADRKRYEVEMENGKLFFDFVVISKDFTWVKSNFCTLEKNNSVTSSDTNMAFVRQTVFAAVKEISATKLLFGYDAIITIGTASHELERNDPSLETNRAQNRALALANSITKVNKAVGNIFTLNLGRYIGSPENPTASVATNSERPAVIVGIRYRGMVKKLINEDFIKRGLAKLISEKRNDLYLKNLFEQYESRNSHININKYPHNDALNICPMN